MLNVTDVKVRLVKPENGKLKGVAYIVIDDCFALHDIKIIESQDGVFMAMPSKKTSNGEYKDIAHPINSETREFLKARILDAYRKALEEIDTQDFSEQN